MIEERKCHAAVSMGNKMFVIGGYNNSTCEIFDSYSRKFSYIEMMNFTTLYQPYFEAVCIGQTIVAFYRKQTEPNGTNILIYDVNKNQWTEKFCSVLKNLSDSSCVKYYVD